MKSKKLVEASLFICHTVKKLCPVSVRVSGRDVCNSPVNAEESEESLAPNDLQVSDKNPAVRSKTCRQFHQYFTSAFFVHYFGAKNHKAERN